MVYISSSLPFYSIQSLYIAKQRTFYDYFTPKDIIQSIIYVCYIIFTLLLDIDGPKTSADDETKVNVSHLWPTTVDLL